MATIKKVCQLFSSGHEATSDKKCRRPSKVGGGLWAAVFFLGRLLRYKHSDSLSFLRTFI